jgi:hypothetical protein
LGAASKFSMLFEMRYMLGDLNGDIRVLCFPCMCAFPLKFCLKNSRAEMIKWLLNNTTKGFLFSFLIVLRSLVHLRFAQLFYICKGAESSSICIKIKVTVKEA